MPRGLKKPREKDSPEYVRKFIQDRKGKIDTAIERMRKRAERNDADYESVVRWRRQIREAESLL